VSKGFLAKDLDSKGCLVNCG